MQEKQPFTADFIHQQLQQEAEQCCTPGQVAHIWAGIEHKLQLPHCKPPLPGHQTEQPYCG